MMMMMMIVVVVVVVAVVAKQEHVPSIIFTALHGMQTRSCDENSVRPSVCLSVRPSVRPSDA